MVGKGEDENGYFWLPGGIASILSTIINKAVIFLHCFLLTAAQICLLDVFRYWLVQCHRRHVSQRSCPALNSDGVELDE